LIRTPLAWKNLTHEPKRLLIAIGGIVFAVLLMFTQTGFRNGLFDSTVAVLKEIDGDLVICSRAKFSLVSYQRFDREYLNLVGSVEDVAEVNALYMENPFAPIRLVHPDGTAERSRPIRVIAYDLDSGLLRGVSADDMEKLSPPMTALVDVKTKSNYGFAVNDLQRLREQHVELSGKKLQLVGNFSLGTDFANDGNLIMSSQNFGRYFPYRNRGADPLASVDLGVVRLQPGADRQRVVEKIQRIMPSEIRVESLDRFRNKEIRFWATNTPIGTIFLIGTIMGFAVGIIICYQVLATDIADHLSEFATLKAMGYSNTYFISLILAEAIYLSVFGFIPGWILSFGLFQLASMLTGLVMTMTIERVLFVFLLTVAMCAISGLTAARKLVSADPASLF
jgi:putative ABC transport system permease protein